MALLAFVLLMCAFRSVTIPVVSIALNLLSVGGAYGLVTLIFQDGHLQGLLGFTSFGALVPWVPLFTFVMLFGLSMDYHVFILSRIRELWTGGASAADAIVDGVGQSAGRGDQRGDHHGGGVLDLRHAVDDRREDARRRPGRRRAASTPPSCAAWCCPPALALLGERAWYLPRWLQLAARPQPGLRGRVPPEPGASERPGRLGGSQPARQAAADRRTARP